MDAKVGSTPTSPETGMQLIVESYSGYKANERPVKFWIGEKPVFVESVEDQWRSTDAIYFRVRDHDGNAYILKYTEKTDVWTLENQRIADKSQSATAETIE